MKIRLDQLNEQLKKSLAPIYLISGDEVLLVDEACDAVRKKAQASGCCERELYLVEDAYFKGDDFLAQSENLSLFSSKKLLELYCLTEKIPEKVGQALLAYAQAPATENCLLIRCGKLPAATQNTTWFKAILQAGVFVQVWPIELARLPQWVAARLKKYNLTCDAAGLRLLAQQGENNLSALSQEIEKLHILYGEGALSVAQIKEVTQDHARFQLFDLIDPLLRGEKTRALKILLKFQEEGVEPALILWVLTKEIRELVQGAKYIAEQKKPAVALALKRHTPKKWEQFLKPAFQVDQQIKGAQSGSVWETLQRWVLQVA